MRTLQEIYDFSVKSLRENGNPYGTPMSRPWSNINPDNLSERCILAQMSTSSNIAIAIDMNELIADVVGKQCGTGSKEGIFCRELANAFDFWNSINNKEVMLKDIAKRYELKYVTPPRKPIPQREPIEYPVEEVC